MSGGNNAFATGNEHSTGDHSIGGASGNASGSMSWDATGDERPYYRDGRYWITLLIIASLYVVRMVMSIGLGAGIVTVQPELTTLAVFLIPILYLALNVSTEGGVSGAIWVLLLSIPRIIAYYQERSYVGVWAQAMQVLVLAVIATLVGRQVSAERSARLRAEGSRRAHLAAEARYHNLFESNDSPIFLVSHSGKILEVNPAAAKLFPANNGNVGMNDFGADANDSNERFELVRKQLHEYRGDLDLSAIVGQDAARELLARGKAYVDGKSMAGMRNDDGSIAGSGVPSVEIRCGEGIYLFRPSVTAIYDEYSQPILQVILEDVTSEAVSLKNAELYARNVLGAQEDERKRLAQELHDGPLQSLIHLCRQVDAASGNREGKKQELEQVREVAEGVVSELRSIARGLRPSILDDLGLVTAISRLLSELEERTGIKTTLGVHGIEWRLQPQVESCLFRVAQEALSNVERHSHATHVAVGLERDRGNVHFLVNDDGDGFETDTVNPSSSNTMGMVGMRERVSLLGGRLYIRSTPRSGVNGAVTGVLPEHTGTSIEVFLPYLPSYAEEASSQ